MSTVTDDLIGILETTLRDKVLGLKGPAQVTIPFKGTFRKKAMIGSEEFIFKGVREGKGGQLIFMLEPVDAQGYDYAEFTEKEAHKHITDYFEIICQCLGGKTPAEWRKSAENAARVKAEKKEAAALEKEKQTYGAHEMWGMF